MPTFRINFRSEALGQAIDINAVVPDKLDSETAVMYLLHGRSDDCNAWLDNTSLLRYAQNYNFLIVMPEVRLSYYADEYMGQNYWTYLTTELPLHIENWFKVNPKSKRFVAGLSMGGYGAFKWALNKDDYFTGAASLSGAVDVLALWQRDKERNDELKRVFRSKRYFAKSENNLVHLLKTQTYEETYFLQMCGTEDFLIEDNRGFKQLAQTQIENYEYLEHPGDHNWEYWDMAIQIVLERFGELM
ncbi:alpha/beta hydrolase [Fundicoccus culcitae]|uniref:Esterase family protein n=1 Tax=Fundicoccus culcitae TaxID=2969821 RepID=A0ABY5P341_9LACT|nr:alpha/beta hydrolase family protein [Fundicoccus culcitae]UUX33025.1 esterase family protein [Fundicoccus culcitae]